MSTKPADSEYGDLKLKYIPPPADLGEGQVYMQKREVVAETSGRISSYIKENPLVPLSFFSTLVFFAAGVTFSVQKKHNLSTRMMYGLVASQVVFMIGVNNGTSKVQKRQELMMSNENTDDGVQDLSGK